MNSSTHHLSIINNNIKKNKRSRTHIRNVFGIIPIPVYTKSFKCRINCIYCPSQPFIPKSYIANEDTLRAQKLDYDPVNQIRYWIRQIDKEYLSEKPQKLEIIILGATFSDLSISYRIDFLKGLYDGLNGFAANDLPEAIRLNKNSKYRACIITIETRPDNITNEECEFLLSLGISKVELGVQSLDDEVLASLKRPGNQDTIKHALQLLKNYGFKVGFHLMINLPFSDVIKDKHMLKEVLTNSELMPDFIKIYPLTLVKDRNIQPMMWKLYENGTWKPYAKHEILNLLFEFLVNVPEHIRVQRIQRQFESKDLLYNDFRIRAILDGMFDAQSIILKCIRSQEERTYKSKVNFPGITNLHIKINHYTDYDYFFTIRNEQNFLLGYARLYVNEKCIIREIKVLGQSSTVGSKSMIQGNGVGKLLMTCLEEFVVQLGFKDLLIVASPGVRGYFEKFGYFEIGNILKKELVCLG